MFKRKKDIYLIDILERHAHHFEQGCCVLTKKDDWDIYQIKLIFDIIKNLSKDIKIIKKKNAYRRFIDRLEAIERV